jgi:limonene-1,2-epoxide hydrolase
VLNERVDSFIVNGRPVVVPVAGVFEISGGKIKAWRDYFDLATYMNQLKGK